MASGQATHEDHHGMHVTPLRLYFQVFGALMALMVATVLVAYVDLGPVNKPLALGIAFTKAILIMYFFMHLNHSSRLIWIFAIMGFVMVTIFFMIGMSDYVARGGVETRGFPAAPVAPTPVYEFLQ